MEFYPPLTLIGKRYVVVSRPLIGGMGIVYLCHDLQDKRPVALKTFKPEYLPDRETRDRFLREGTTWVNLGKHLHVVRAYGVERIGDGSEVFLVLEQIAKEQGRTDASLRSWLTQGKPLLLTDALLISLQITRGLRHASEHIAGFVHRDLKPENVLIGADRLQGWSVNRVRVTDFGLAAVLSGLTLPDPPSDSPISNLQSPSRTQLTHGIVGTPLYMAPEQWRGEDVSAQTDIYALGLMLFEMVTGERAVSGGTMKDLEQAHTQGKLRLLPPTLPEGMRAIVGRCLRLVASERYGSWEEVEQALSQAYTALTHESVPPPAAPQTLERSERVALGWAQSAMGASYLDIGKADVARDYFERARSVGAKEGEKRLESAGLDHLGLASRTMGDAWGAIGYFEQGLAIIREIGDRQGEINSLVGLGGAYSLLGVLDKRQNGLNPFLSSSHTRRAIGYYEEALGIGRETGDAEVEGEILGNLGREWRNIGEFAKGLTLSQQAVLIFRATGNRRGECEELSLQGGTYYVLQEVSQAILCWEEARRTAIEIGAGGVEGNCSFKLANEYYKQKRFQEALPLAQRALLLYKEEGNSLWAEDAQQLVAKLQSRLSSSDGAITAANPAQEAFDAFQHARSRDEMSQAVQRYPILTNPQFIQAIQQAIKEQVPVEHRPALQQRLDDLKRIAKGE